MKRYKYINNSGNTEVTVSWSPTLETFIVTADDLILGGSILFEHFTTLEAAEPSLARLDSWLPADIKGHLLVDSGVTMVAVEEPNYKEFYKKVQYLLAYSKSLSAEDFKNVVQRMIDGRDSLEI